MEAALPACAQSEISPNHRDDAPVTIISFQARAQANDAVSQQMSAEKAMLNAY